MLGYDEGIKGVISDCRVLVIILGNADVITLGMILEQIWDL